ncbi:MULTISPECIES: type I restriction-modification system subunit M [Staphylococcus]|uniref:site-specific DNA-methyltransferase (adenine-specific) n=2 Tax=Staphylococcus schleiferi TaxID=1295 RepID=A0ABX0FVV5_STASC|nr:MULTISPECIES: type I restriction-modification system subunit M [Staphylococcus]QGS46486.1 type I restriction-modification system subunit M [Mammaliicoccus fleurettii]EPD50092.1 type I restriction-modification system, M subunit [Staphylococcus sp. HGB0015]MBF1992073.1 type I restriction-modification system subunit M [Staphylococcus schleiferi]MBF2037523.1 type I restriction-modification system subunit M [Staphylococcus schleiferi]MBF2099533.1 type I restriction-modification system subunit M 
MSITEKQRQQQAELQKKLWSIANDLRGNMDASEFRNYILGLIFYRFLSEKTEVQVDVLLEGENMTYEQAWQNEDYKAALEAELLERIGYVIEPQDLFSTLIKKIENQTFEIEDLHKAISKIETSTRGQESEDDFDHLFDDMDLNSSRLGNTNAARTKLISKVMMNLSTLPFVHSDIEIDMLGDAYEYLIGQFAATAGKKAGEFYTPQQVSKILAKIVTANKQDLKNVYDPTCGSGSLLLRVGREANVRHYYGQEYNSTTFNLARMNMLLHDVNYNHFSIENGDTLEHPAVLEEKFEAVVANPPYSAKWSADPSFLDDERFSNYGKLAPKSKADFAFIQHMIYHLDDNGTMAVILPHGVLFRGAAEGVIRKYLIEEKNYLDAIIGLPANLFFGTSIPTAILVFKKCREKDENVLFIDASQSFEKGKNQNHLSDEDVNKIVETYLKREDIEKYSHVVTLDEIKENDYNLNIPRYVDTFEEEEPVDLEAVQQEIKAVDEEIASLEKEIAGYLKELGVEMHD